MIRTFLVGVGLCLLVVSCDGRAIEPCVGDCIPIPSGDGILAAELHLPTGIGPHPALVLVHGSGRIERGSLDCGRSSWLANGLALLCYDKRGVGQSSGRYRATGVGNSEEVFPTLAGDVVAVVDYLKSVPEIDPDRIGLIGASQAGWLMPLAASRSDDVAFIISVSGATSSVGISDRFDAIAEAGMSEQEIAADLATFDGTPGYDPRPVLEQLAIPVLWLYGARDQSNPTANDIAIIEEIRSEQGSDFTIEVFPNGNHELAHADTGQLLDGVTPVLAWLGEIGMLG